ncbi:gp53-like domain-containing protein [Trabulsiella odontotermitis]|uniref:gp53-like domain-containing protein n=1 Tax=Trabulsiella odontotermitis TaxID=379893 RepID=UPI0006763E15|nr:hypothetical protein [Trabulsiella odontotermitis]KNC92537.1 hypothetical protein GM30_16080 [Trabulsiella odontotermitis]
MKPLMPPIGTADNLFIDGDPSQGTDGTIVTATWLNNVQGSTRDVQQELISILTAAGLQPDDDNLQLLTALKALMLSRKNPFADIAADGAAARATALANLQLGEAAKRAVGTGVNQIPDMGSFASGTGTNSVWFKFPNGMIVQAGYVVTSASAAVTVTFPTAFLTSPTSGGVAYSLTPTTAGNIIACATGSTLTVISGVRTFNTSGAQQANGVFWIAVGN